jgi:hypothetical protein
MPALELEIALSPHYRFARLFWYTASPYIVFGPYRERQVDSRRVGGRSTLTRVRATRLRMDGSSWESRFVPVKFVSYWWVKNRAKGTGDSIKTPCLFPEADKLKSTQHLDNEQACVSNTSSNLSSAP